MNRVLLTGTHHKPVDRPDEYTVVAEGSWQGILCCRFEAAPSASSAFRFYPFIRLGKKIGFTVLQIMPL